ncbi:gp22 domain protein [Burkholderia thailandensis MSMB121]|nr:gp22 domain protein [Burkholderia thailandensis MSMB121]
MDRERARVGHGRADCLRNAHGGARLYRIGTGAPAEITQAGITPEDAGLTPPPRLSDEYVWRDGTWVVNAAVVAGKEREAAMNAFMSRMEKARAKNLGKADAFERPRFDARAQYQMKLVRVVDAPAGALGQKLVLEPQR